MRLIHVWYVYDFQWQRYDLMISRQTLICTNLSILFRIQISHSSNGSLESTILDSTKSRSHIAPLALISSLSLCKRNTIIPPWVLSYITLPKMQFSCHKILITYTVYSIDINYCYIYIYTRVVWKVRAKSESRRHWCMSRLFAVSSISWNNPQQVSARSVYFSAFGIRLNRGSRVIF